MSDFLFARPSLLEGIGRNIDLFGVLNSYNGSKSGQEADLKAMQNDIAILKHDFFKAYESVINGYSK
jgi:hypothetical protein